MAKVIMKTELEDLPLKVAAALKTIVRSINGSKGGKVRSKRKLRSSRANASLPPRPGSAPRGRPRKVAA